MKGTKWLQTIEDFFFDGHKQECEDYQITIDGECYTYIVPELWGENWTYFWVNLNMNREAELTPAHVFMIAKEANVVIAKEILDYFGKEYAEK